MFIKNMVEEIQLQKEYLGNQKINTIYLGGGTPSLLGADELNVIFNEIYDNFMISESAEITLEANPDDISLQWIREIKGLPVNRISVGIQSFHNDDLLYLSRIHNASDAEEAIKRLQDSGIGNLSIDLIYGIPTLNNDKWEYNLEKFFALDIQHLSAYALTVEDKTALQVLISKKKTPAPDELDTINQFKILVDLTEKQKYIHYEISNFAREGHYSRHNSIYWTGGYYLGLGPSAHSFNGYSRRWNKASIKDWLALKDYYKESFEEEILTREQRFNEYVMTSLRTIWGCDIDLVKHEFGDKYAEHILHSAKEYLVCDKLELKGSRLFLTKKGKLFADGIASDLFILV